MRNYIIAKSFNKSDSQKRKPYYSIWDIDKEGGLTEPFSKIALGEPNLKTVCKELAKKLAPPKRKTRLPGFSITNLKSITLNVETDSNLSLLYPLTEPEMEKFHEEYSVAGRYE